MWSVWSVCVECVVVVALWSDTIVNQSLNLIASSEQ